MYSCINIRKVKSIIRGSSRNSTHISTSSCNISSNTSIAGSSSYASSGRRTPAGPANLTQYSRAVAQQCRSSSTGVVPPAIGPKETVFAAKKLAVRCNFPLWFGARGAAASKEVTFGASGG